MDTSHVSLVSLETIVDKAPSSVSAVRWGDFKDKVPEDVLQQIKECYDEYEIPESHVRAQAASLASGSSGEVSDKDIASSLESSTAKLGKRIPDITRQSVDAQISGASVPDTFQDSKPFNITESLEKIMNSPAVADAEAPGTEKLKELMRAKVEESSSLAAPKMDDWFKKLAEACEGLEDYHRVRIRDLEKEIAKMEWERDNMDSYDMDTAMKRYPQWRPHIEEAVKEGVWTELEHGPVTKN